MNMALVHLLWNLHITISWPDTRESKINNSYSGLKLLKYGVSQEYTLGQNSFLWDLFLIIRDIHITSCAVDNTPYCTSNASDTIKNTIKRTSINVFKWLCNNGMKANIHNWHFLSMLDITSKVATEIFSMQSSYSQKLLVVKIDRKLSSNEHLSKLCKKASMKIAALARIFRYMI